MMPTMVRRSKGNAGLRETRMPRKQNARKAKRHTMFVASVRAS